MSDDDRIELMLRFRRELAVILDRPESDLLYSDAWAFLAEPPSGKPSTRHVHLGGRIRYKR